MSRTPMQMHIMVDDVLNDVHLFLPYFNAETVKDVTEALQSTEGGNIPTDVYGEAFGEKTFDTLTVRPKQTAPRAVAPHREIVSPDQISLDDIAQPETGTTDETSPGLENGATASSVNAQPAIADNTQTTQVHPVAGEAAVNPSTTSTAEEIVPDFDREELMKAINDAGLLTYEVRSVRISNYLHSLFALSHLFSQSLIYQNAYDEVCDDIVRMIHDYIESLKSSGKYSELATKVLQFKLNTQVFDVFGESVDNNAVHDFLSATDTDLDRQFRLADTKLGNEGIGVKYGRAYQAVDNPNGFKIDIIIFAADSNCIAALNAFAKDRFHEMNDRYRRKTISLPVKYKKKYNDIVSDGDIVSAHIFMLPETISCEHNTNGRIYSNHLFVDNTGVAKIALNNWEQGVLDEEAAQPDFVCWLRNPPRKPWSLSIPYEKDGVTKPAYPDFLVVRADSRGGYIIDILEPHDQTRTDNLGKAKGFAEYARRNPIVGRIQLIRMASDGKFKRLDMSKNAIRDEVKQAINDDELTHIFDTDGFCM